MISIVTAKKLKRAGLYWAPALHDFFAIPDRGLDNFVFVISDMAINVELFGTFPVVTFSGASEWALDYVTLADVVWLPTEEQLRLSLATRVFNKPGNQIRLIFYDGNYRCELVNDNDVKEFVAENASEAYANALLTLLSQE